MDFMAVLQLVLNAAPNLIADVKALIATIEGQPQANANANANMPLAQQITTDTEALEQKLQS